MIMPNKKVKESRDKKDKQDRIKDIENLIENKIYYKIIVYNGIEWKFDSDFILLTLAKLRIIELKKEGVMGILVKVIESTIYSFHDGKIN